MKNTFIILTLQFVLCCSTIQKTQAQDKKIAMLEPIPVSEGISGMIKNMVRGELTKSLSREPGFSAFTRVDVDQVMKEFNFQESGMVNDEQRKKLGQMSGADYVCISKISKEENAYYIEASLVDIESGEIKNPGTAFAEGGIKNVNLACRVVAADMVGKQIEAKPIAKIEPIKDSSTKEPKDRPVVVKSAYPKVVYNNAYKISILSLTRQGTNLTLYFSVKNTGRYSTVYHQLDYNGQEFTLYSEEGDVIKSDSGYYIKETFSPGITIKKKVVFRNVPTDITYFTHLTFEAGADTDQSDGNTSRNYLKQAFQNLPIEKE